MMRFSHIPVLLVTLVGGTLALPIMTFAAEAPMAPPAQAAAQAQNEHPKHDWMMSPHVEGHIAFLHAELGITPAQEPQFAALASAMREDVKTMHEAEDRVYGGQNGGPVTAVQYLQDRVTFANLRAQGEARYLDAFKPLYATLSDAQKRMADELMMPHEPQE